MLSILNSSLKTLCKSTLNENKNNKNKNIIINNNSYNNDNDKNNSNNNSNILTSGPLDVAIVVAKANL